MILTDTSVWVDHLRSGSRPLAELLIEGRVWVHPFVIGEVACGNLSRRSEVLSLLKALPHVKTVTDEEILFFIEGHKLMGRGIGLVDVHLLASARLSGVRIWTRDKKLTAEAERLGLAYGP